MNVVRGSGGPFQGSHIVLVTRSRLRKDEPEEPQGIVERGKREGEGYSI